MRFYKGKNYKLIEFDGGMVITESNQNLKNEPTAKPLIIADAGALLTYLDRYFFEREQGKGLQYAHDKAMNTAQITKIMPKGVTQL